VTNAVSDPSLVVVLGATGDLMRRKLLPALYRLSTRGALHERTRILGAARTKEHGDHSYRAWARQALVEAGVSAEDAAGRWCDERLYYQAIAGGTVADYRVLGSRIEAIEREAGLSGNRVFYLALPPEAFSATINGLGQSTLNRSQGWTRIVVEKPFGRDLASAQELNRLIHQHFDESQVYRIDHYLGKETVQNLLVFRFANPIFETLWNRDRVEHVQITVAEEIGVEGRAGYYEGAGALRDMIQNHLTQLMTLVAMEVPGAFGADAIRNEKVKALHAVAPIERSDVVLAQYTAGRIGGREVPAYRKEPGVAPDSQTETHAALRLEIENWRWHGVPFYLRAGKRMARRLTEITVVFHRPPVSLFPTIDDPKAIDPNELAITIQPDEGFELGFEVKAPGQEIDLATQRLRFRYAEAFSPLADAYETLLLEILTGDQTLFVRADEVEAAWRLYTPVLEKPPRIEFYPAGTWGPPSANQLLAKDGHRWRQV
jgi:glucose-6-phosphate 1-dehydrogenase